MVILPNMVISEDKYVRTYQFGTKEQNMLNISFSTKRLINIIFIDADELQILHYCGLIEMLHDMIRFE